MPFPKGGKHKPETVEKIRGGMSRFRENQRRDRLVRTGVGRKRETPEPKPRENITRQREE